MAKGKFMNLKQNERKDALWCGEGGCKGVGEGVLGIGGWLVGVWVDGACWGEGRGDKEQLPVVSW